MTHHPIRTLPDGTRLYSGFQKYKPLAPEERKYGVNKPDDPRAERFHGLWFLPLELVDEEQREMPETLADDLTLQHKASCLCRVCRRPEARRYWRRARKEARLKT